ncbi:MAG: CHAT domain-containing protein [Oscillochloris sp.]|nr:CHAT domain-containing protein [Oscillochloris sp.]
MDDYVGIEINLAHLSEDRYRAELRYTRPDANTDRAPASGQVRLSPSALDQHALDPQAYGGALSAALFEDPALSAELLFGLAAADTLDRKLRLRLFVQRDAAELHRIRWETLGSPGDTSCLLLHPRVLFSRMIAGSDLDDIRLRPKSDLRALVVIANPAPLGDPVRGVEITDGGTRRRLAPIDVAAEQDRATQSLQGVTLDLLASDPASARHVTLEAIEAALRTGPYDILYLVCHGALIRDTRGQLWPHIYIERDTGEIHDAPGDELVRALRSMPDRPSLVVLASCQSAGDGESLALGDNGALAALGPQIAAAGVPSVLAMQGNVLMSTVAAFMPTFFDQLVKHGQVDLAAAAARSVVHSRPDSWMPVLFSRLRHGRIWYVPGFTASDGFDRWPNLLNGISATKCTPILGFGLLEPLIGTRSEIARSWAEASGFPLHPDQADDLASVAQYLAVSQSPGTVLAMFCSSLQQRLVARNQAALQACGLDERTATLSDMVRALGKQGRQANPDEPHAVLARLPLTIYVTANPDGQLADALHEQGRSPVVEFCRWKSTLSSEDYPPAIYESESAYQPSQERPLVYHLFGVLDHPESLVITEDDYFDFLMWVNRTESLPPAVTRAWSAHALLFLGLTIDDWGFRVLFRSVLNDDRRQRRRSFRSVAVQVSPSDQHRDPDRARRYLEQYVGFDQVPIDTFWGNVGDFVAELSRHWKQR